MSLDKEPIRVKIDTTTRPVPGYNTEDSTALVVTDVGREDFSAPSHPSVTVPNTSSGATSLASLVWAATSGSTKIHDVIAKRGFLLQSSTANTISIVVGGPNTSASNGMLLPPGSGMMLDITKLSNIYVVTTHSSTTAILFWLDM